MAGMGELRIMTSSVLVVKNREESFLEESKHLLHSVRYTFENSPLVLMIYPKHLVVVHNFISSCGSHRDFKVQVINLSLMLPYDVASEVWELSETRDMYDWTFAAPSETFRMGSIQLANHLSREDLSGHFDWSPFAGKLRVFSYTGNEITVHVPMTGNTRVELIGKIGWNQWTNFTTEVN
jgi:hypothetical protein